MKAFKETQPIDVSLQDPDTGLRVNINIILILVLICHLCILLS